ncbi:hypothetical protein Tco_1440948 [Tanacetum coccineum]
MTHDPPKGVVRFTNGTDKIAYKMPHKIELYNSLSDLEREHTKSVYLRNEEDKRRGVEYVMSKILGFYKECLELGPEYATGIADEGEVTYFYRTLGTMFNLSRKAYLLEDMQIPSVGHGDDVVGFKRRRRDLSSDGVEDSTTASEHNRLKLDLEDSTW